MVGERARRLGRCGPHERRPVGGRRQRDGARPEHDQALGTELGDQPAETRPERRLVRRLASIDDTRGTRGEEPDPVVLGEGAPRRVERAFERARVGGELGCEDEDRDRGHV